MINTIKDLSGAVIYQVVRIATPLFIYPILLYQYGIDEFGLFTFFIGWTGLHVVLIEFGSNLHGMRELISAQSEDRKISLVTSITTVRLLLATLSAVACLIAIPDALGFALLNGLFVVLQHNYFFQAGNRFHPLIMGFIASRAIFFIVLLFELAEGGRDLALIFVACNLIGAIVCHCVDMLRILKVIRKPHIESILNIFAKLIRYFMSGLATNINTSGVIAICGLFLSPDIIGRLALVDKARSSAIAVSFPLNQFFMRRWYKGSTKISIRVTLLAYLSVGILQIAVFLIMIAYFWWQDWNSLFDKEIFLYFPVILLIINTGYVFGTLGLLRLDGSKLYLKNTLTGSVVLLSLILILFSDYFESIGDLHFILFAMVAAETTISLLMLLDYIKIVKDGQFNK